MKRFVVAIAILLLPAPAWPQTGSACGQSAAALSAGAFIECARTGTEKYRDQSVAIADGYRRVGRDFPAMGEHWIRIALIFDGRFDPGQPEVLNYASVAGRPQLVGAGYAVPLLSGESPPEVPAGREAWHDHMRTIEDETVLPHSHVHGNGQDAPRLAMMHAWIWAPNPDGVFSADNWALSYLRLGTTPPSGAPAAAGKALSLATGGADYFQMSIEAATAPTHAERLTLYRAIAAARTRVESLVNKHGLDGFSAEDVAALVRIWTEMWSSVEAALGPRARQQLKNLPIR